MTSSGHGAFIEPNWPAPARVRAASTLRGGGVSQGPYASLNLGTAVGDDAGSVIRNRQILAEMLNLPAEPRWLKQVHGTTVLDLGSFDISTRSSDVLAEPPAADGAVTSRPGLPCAVLTADCLPVLLCDTGGTRVGVAHAGWRGLAGGVVESTVRRMGIEPRRTHGVARAGYRPVRRMKSVPRYWKRSQPSIRARRRVLRQTPGAAGRRTCMGSPASAWSPRVSRRSTAVAGARIPSRSGFSRTAARRPAGAWQR